MESQTNSDDTNFSATKEKFSDHESSHQNSQLNYEQPILHNRVGEMLDPHTGDHEEREIFTPIFPKETLPIENLLIASKCLKESLYGKFNEERFTLDIEHNESKNPQNSPTPNFDNFAYSFTPKPISNDYSLIKSLLSPTQSEKINFHDRHKRIESHHTTRKPKVAYFDVTQLKGSSSDGVSKERFDQLLNENQFLKAQVKYYKSGKEENGNKLKAPDEYKNKVAPPNKKPEESKNQVSLQKKVGTLEREKKDLIEEKKAMLGEMKSLSEKYQKLVKKLKSEENRTSSKAGKSEVEDLLEKFYFVKNELQISRESERSLQQVQTEQTKTTQWFKENYETESREKNFLLAKNLELIERIEKLQKSVKSTPKLFEEGSEAEESDQIKILQQKVWRLENEKNELIRKLEENSLPKLVRLTNEENLDLQNFESSKELRMTFGSFHESQELSPEPKNCKSDNLWEKEDLSTSYNFTRTLEPDTQSFYLSSDSFNEEQLNLIFAELKEKLCEEDFQQSKNSIQTLIDSLKTSLRSNELINKYNKLLIHYFQALDKIRLIEKPKTIQLQRAEGPVSSIATSTTCSPDRQFRELDSASQINPFKTSKFLSHRSPNSASPESVKSPNNFFLGREFLLPNQKKQKKESSSHLSIEVQNDMMSGNSARSKSFEKLKSVTKGLRSPKVCPKIGSRNSEINDTALSSLQTTPMQLSTTRTKSTPKTKKSYRDIYVQKKKETSLNKTACTDR